MVVGSTRRERDAGARDEFERFAARVSPALLRSAYLLSGDRGHAEDLLQTTLWRTAQHWEEIHRSPDAYAHQVLVNLSRDRRRDLGRRPEEAALGESTAEPARDVSERLIERDAMTRAVRRLPRRQREVLVLRFFLDLSVGETAVALGASEGAVKSHTARALVRMRQLLGARDDPSELSQSEVSRAD